MLGSPDTQLCSLHVLIYTLYRGHVRTHRNVLEVLTSPAEHAAHCVSSCETWTPVARCPRREHGDGRRGPRSAKTGRGHVRGAGIRQSDELCRSACLADSRTTVTQSSRTHACVHDHITVRKGCTDYM